MLKGSILQDIYLEGVCLETLRNAWAVVPRSQSDLDLCTQRGCGNVTTFLMLWRTLSKSVLVTGTPAKVRAVRVFDSDASCALPEQFGVQRALCEAPSWLLTHLLSRLAKQRSQQPLAAPSSSDRAIIASCKSRSSGSLSAWFSELAMWTRKVFFLGPLTQAWAGPDEVGQLALEIAHVIPTVQLLLA